MWQCGTSSGILNRTSVRHWLKRRWIGKIDLICELPNASCYYYYYCNGLNTLAEKRKSEDILECREEIRRRIEKKKKRWTLTIFHSLKWNVISVRQCIRVVDRLLMVNKITRRSKTYERRDVVSDKKQRRAITASSTMMTTTPMTMMIAVTRWCDDIADKV